MDKRLSILGYPGASGIGNDVAYWFVSPHIYAWEEKQRFTD
jgi:hypothetical protein